MGQLLCNLQAFLNQIRKLHEKIVVLSNWPLPGSQRPPRAQRGMIWISPPQRKTKARLGWHRCVCNPPADFRQTIKMAAVSRMDCLFSDKKSALI